MRAREPLIGTRRVDIYCFAEEAMGANLAVRSGRYTYWMRLCRSNKFPVFGVTVHGAAKGRGLWVRVEGPAHVRVAKRRP